MTKAAKAFALSLALIAGLLASGCPKKPKVVTHPNTSTANTSSVPDVAIPVPSPTSTEGQVKPPADFVQDTPRVSEEVLPSNVEELNRVAQQRGYISDAFFNYDEAALSSDAQNALTTSASWLKKNGQYALLIEGHCDERGTEQYNLALGDRRANTAKEYLVTLGVDAARIRTVSYGEERPFDAGHDESAWSKNRRAHLVLVGK
ncbi:MAG: peptidoglycan-associated lipoprotein Pal [Acidobacteriota bacterium]